MADNYLEKRAQELQERPRKVQQHKSPSLDTLLHRNRSCRSFAPKRVVSESELKTMVQAASLSASGMNRQPLRYHLVTGEMSAAVLPHIVLGGALPELHLPEEGKEPSAYIIICSSVAEDRAVDIDMGFAAQSILLKATEMGLAGVFVLNFRKDALKQALDLKADPLALIALGKRAEVAVLTKVPEDGSLKYYRKEGVHFVPKLGVEDLLV